MFKNIVEQDLQFPEDKHEALFTYIKTMVSDNKPCGNHDNGEPFKDVKDALEYYFEQEFVGEVHKNKDGTIYVDLDHEDEFTDEDDPIWSLSAFMKDHAFIEYSIEDSYYRMYVYEGNVYKQYGEVVFPKMEGQ